MTKTSAVDAVSPAFERTKQFLFRPFRWSVWARIALLGLATGELSSGGCHFNIPSDWGTRRDPQQFAAPMPTLPPEVQKLMLLLPLIIAAFVVLYLLWVYVSSVGRFMLFETVLTGQVRLRESWERWQQQGRRYFWFNILVLLIGGAVAVVFIGGLVLVAAAAGLAHPGSSGGIAAMVGMMALMLVALVPLVVVFLVIYVLVKDFAIPMMALEKLTMGEAWRRMWAMVGAEKGGFAGYIGMKIVLAIGAAFMMGILALIVILLIALPVGGVGFVAVLGGKAAGLSWNPATIAMAATVLTVVVAFLMYALAFVGAPVTIFFPSYAMFFLASRYEPLHAALYPAPPPEPELPPDVGGGV